MHQHIIKVLQPPQPHQPINIRHRASARREKHQTLKVGLVPLVWVKHVAKHIIIKPAFRPDVPTEAHALPGLTTTLVRCLGRGHMVGRAGFGRRGGGGGGGGGGCICCCCCWCCSCCCCCCGGGGGGGSDGLFLIFLVFFGRLLGLFFGFFCR